MSTGRRFSLPIDPWPRASLAERAAVGSVLVMLLVLPFVAAVALLAVAILVAHHVYRAYDLGASARALIDRSFAPRKRGAALPRPDIR